MSNKKWDYLDFYMLNMNWSMVNKFYLQFFHIIPEDMLKHMFYQMFFHIFLLDMFQHKLIHLKILDLYKQCIMQVN